MLVRNKWNSMLYEVVTEDDKEVTLKRTVDYEAKGKLKGSILVVSKSEYYFNYIVKEVEK